MEFDSPPQLTPAETSAISPLTQEIPLATGLLPGVKPLATGIIDTTEYVVMDSYLNGSAGDVTIYGGTRKRARYSRSLLSSRSPFFSKALESHIGHAAAKLVNKNTYDLKSLWRFYLDVAAQAHVFQLLDLSSEALEHFLLAIKHLDDAQEYEEAIGKLVAGMERALPELSRRHALAMCKEGSFVEWARAHGEHGWGYVELLVAMMRESRQSMANQDLHRQVQSEPNFANDLTRTLAVDVRERQAARAVPRDPVEQPHPLVVRSEYDVKDNRIRTEQFMPLGNASFFEKRERRRQPVRPSMEGAFETVFLTSLESPEMPKEGDWLRSLNGREELDLGVGRRRSE